MLKPAFLAAVLLLPIPAFADAQLDQQLAAMQQQVDVSTGQATTGLGSVGVAFKNIVIYVKQLSAELESAKAQIADLTKERDSLKAALKPHEPDPAKK